MSSYEFAAIARSMSSYEVAAIALSILAVAFVAVLLPKLPREAIAGLFLLYAAAVAGYFMLFYPCPWYKIKELRAKVHYYAEANRWSFVEDIGKELCDCGDQPEGWYWQAESEYHSGQYLTAINFWRRSLRAQPDVPGDIAAKIADAYIELDDHKMAVDQYQIISAKNPESMDYRFGYGRALIFNRRYKDAVDVLRGVPDTYVDVLRGVPDTYNEDGLPGGARIFEAAARFGYAASTESGLSRDVELQQAKNTLCRGMALSREWRKLLEGDSDERHFSKIRELIAPYLGSDCPK